MRFRPCIDLKNGKVVQIVGGTLRDQDDQSTVTNFTSEKSAAAFARLYQQDGLVGGHVIALGPGNQDAALAALQSYPGGLQMGGGRDTGECGALSRCWCKPCHCHILRFPRWRAG